MGVLWSETDSDRQVGREVRLVEEAGGVRCLGSSVGCIIIGQGT